MEKTHESFSVKESGFWVKPELCYIGASPDAISTCRCHGTGCVEIKCPYCARDLTVKEAVDSSKKNFCLWKSEDGGVVLKQNHPYWSQCQVQLYVTNFKFDDIVVWTERDVYIQRIMPDAYFMSSCLDTLKELYVSAILPELLAK